MIVKVCRVLNTKLDEYKPVLDKFNAHYQSETLAYIEFKAVNEIFDFMKELKQDLYIDRFLNNTIQIYDDYIE